MNNMIKPYTVKKRGQRVVSSIEATRSRDPCWAAAVKCVALSIPMGFNDKI